jgi:N-acylneuraminate cytidylyltransferase
VPRKNLHRLQGHPMVAYAVAAGLQAELVTRTVCTTDDAEIAEVARQYGAETPFMRPAELAQDHTLDLPVFQHALAWLNEHEQWQPDIVVQLRPTSPLRFAGQVDQAVQLLLDHPQATGVRTVCPAPSNPFKMWRLQDEAGDGQAFMQPFAAVPGIAEPYNHPRQELPEVWWQTGNIDATRPEVIMGGSMTGQQLLPLRTESRYAIDIDTPLSLQFAELVMEQLECIRPAPGLDWAAVRLLALDVDGTLTPGTMYYGAEGEALKRFHTHDGHGLAQVRRAGVHVAIITSEDSPIVAARAEKLGIGDLHMGVKDKLPVLREICAQTGIPLEAVAYVGDDLGDLSPMQAVAEAGGIPCAVADARPEIRRIARFICPARGGYGAVRDVCDQITAARAR